MNSPRHSTLVLFGAALVVLSGCGVASTATAPPTAEPAVVSIAVTADGTPPSTSDAASGVSGNAPGFGHACDLLTPQELAPLLGPGASGLDTSSGTTSACAYTGAGVTTVVVDP